jgi:hypothetical protein
MKSTKACALAVAGERWLDVIVMLYFVAYNRIKVVGTLMRLRRKGSGFANIEDLKLDVLKKGCPATGIGPCSSLIYEAPKYMHACTL